MKFHSAVKKLQKRNQRLRNVSALSDARFHE
jgi:hypothetical protein